MPNILGRRALPAGRRAPEDLSPNFGLGTLAASSVSHLPRGDALDRATVFGDVGTKAGSKKDREKTGLGACTRRVPYRG
jgi:hypothetical protein